MKFAVFVYADQTIVYVSDGHIDPESPWEGTTVVHRHAALWDDRSKAQDEADRWGRDLRGPRAKVEVVRDEAEFIAREDTW